MENLCKELINKLEGDLYVSDTGLVDGLIEDGYLSPDDWHAINALHRNKKKVKALIKCLAKTPNPISAFRALARVLRKSHQHLVKVVENAITRYENNRPARVDYGEQLTRSGSRNRVAVENDESADNEIVSRGRVAVENDDSEEKKITGNGDSADFGCDDCKPLQMCYKRKESNTSLKCAPLSNTVSPYHKSKRNKLAKASYCGVIPSNKHNNGKNSNSYFPTLRNGKITNRNEAFTLVNNITKETNSWFCENIREDAGYLFESSCNVNSPVEINLRDSGYVSSRGSSVQLEGTGSCIESENKQERARGVSESSTIVNSPDGNDSTDSDQFLSRGSSRQLKGFTRLNFYNEFDETDGFLDNQFTLQLSQINKVSYDRREHLRHASEPSRKVKSPVGIELRDSGYFASRGSSSQLEGTDNCIESENEQELVSGVSESSNYFYSPVSDQFLSRSSSSQLEGIANCIESDESDGFLDKPFALKLSQINEVPYYKNEEKCDDIQINNVEKTTTAVGPLCKPMQASLNLFKPAETCLPVVYNPPSQLDTGSPSSPNFDITSLADVVNVNTEYTCSNAEPSLSKPQNISNSHYTQNRLYWSNNQSGNEELEELDDISEACAESSDELNTCRNCNSKYSSQLINTRANQSNNITYIIQPPINDNEACMRSTSKATDIQEVCNVQSNVLNDTVIQCVELVNEGNHECSKRRSDSSMFYLTTSSSDSETNTEVTLSDLDDNEIRVLNVITRYTENGILSDLMDELIENGMLSDDDYNAVHAVVARHKKSALLAKLISSNGDENTVFISGDLSVTTEKASNNTDHGIIAEANCVAKCTATERDTGCLYVLPASRQVVIKDLDKVFDKFNTMLNNGTLKIDQLPENPKVLCIVYYLKACDKLYAMDFDAAEDYIEKADRELARTDHPIQLQLRLEILTSKTWYALKTNRLGKMQHMLEEYEQYMKSVPGGWTFKARGWFYFDYGRLYAAMMEHILFLNNGKDICNWRRYSTLEHYRQCGIKCARMAVDYFKQSDSSDGPIGAGFSWCLIAQLYLCCGKQFSALQLHVPKTDIEHAQKMLECVENQPGGISSVLKSTYLLSKCDLNYRLGKLEDAKKMASDCLKLSLELNLTEEITQARCRESILNEIISQISDLEQSRRHLVPMIRDSEEGQSDYHA